MSRTPSGTVSELESLIGLRGSISVDSTNRALIQKWLTANGVKAITAKAQSISALQDAYNDQTDRALDTLKEAIKDDFVATPVNRIEYIPAMGDKVELLEDYGPFKKGEIAEVVEIDHVGSPESLIGITQKETRTTTRLFAYRTRLVERKPIPEQHVQKEETKMEENPEITKALVALTKALGTNKDSPKGLTQEEVISLIKEHASVPLAIHIKDNPVVVLPNEPRHKDFEKILKAVVCGNVALIGAAGSGKTTIAEQVAKALGVNFYFNGAITSEYKLTGFVDAHGKTVRTPFREAYEHGGLYLFDEIDASMPAAVLAFNAALANGQADFPDGTVKRHKDFYCMAAANTYWTGADRVYVGRNQLDGATLDRFIFIDLPYDEELERLLAGNNEWVNRVQSVRRKCVDLKLRHIVSPRASIMGAKLLTQGLHQTDVEAMVLFKGLDAATRAKIEG